jgi:hypothetical protein
MPSSTRYASVADVKASLRITDNVDDTLIEVALGAASDHIDAYANRVFYNMGTAVRYYAATDPYFCAIDDLISISELATAVTSNGNYDTIWGNYVNGAPGDYQLEPLNASYPTDGLMSPTTGIRALWRYLFPTLGGNALVRVTGVWGWSSVPSAVKAATIIQAARLFKRNDSPNGVIGFGDLGVTRVSNILDPDVRMLLEPYVLTRMFA